MRSQERRREEIRLQGVNARQEIQEHLRQMAPASDHSFAISWWEGVRQLAEDEPWKSVEAAKRDGHTWAEIAAGLGTTPGGARQRFRSRQER